MTIRSCGGTSAKSAASRVVLAALVPPQSSTVCQASALPQRVTTRARLSHQLDRNSGGRTRQISAQI
jgi:hypothetical protein